MNCKGTGSNKKCDTILFMNQYEQYELDTDFGLFSYLILLSYLYVEVMTKFFKPTIKFILGGPDLFQMPPMKKAYQTIFGHERPLNIERDNYSKVYFNGHKDVKDTQFFSFHDMST